MTLKTDFTVSRPALQAVIRQAHADRAAFVSRLMSEFGRKIKDMIFGHRATLPSRGLRRSAA
jgi:hypothetical protein